MNWTKVMQGLNNLEGSGTSDLLDSSAKVQELINGHDRAIDELRTTLSIVQSEDAQLIEKLQRFQQVSYCH
jgi:hypothetical protein